MINPYTLHQGDALATLRKLKPKSVDSIVTDPPYELGFMDAAWDSSGIAFQRKLWRAALRALKPGGHLLAFSSTRTYHRLVCAIEDAGFEVRDQLAWVYGSGMPKSRDLGEGWGTTLKPSWEPIVLARKPFKGTTAECRAQHGTGGLNVDACRIELGADAAAYARNCPGDRGHGETRERGQTDLSQGGGRAASGRWPANLLHDGSAEVLAHFPAEAGGKAGVTGNEPSAASTGAVTNFRARVATEFHGDTGSAARFFYCPKASAAERHAGLVDPGPQFRHGSTPRDAELVARARRGNFHPTVKPLAVCRWLQRLVTPAGGVTLDLFAGSGSFGVSAILEGFHPVMIELDRDTDGAPLGYMDIIRARCTWALEERQREAEAVAQAAALQAFRAAQLDIFGADDEDVTTELAA